MGHLSFYVYIITNVYNGTLYIGHTDDLGVRMEQHRHGTFDGFAKRYGLMHLIWFQEFETRDAAFRRERQIKAWKRGWKIELIAKDNPHWFDISKCPVWPMPDPEDYPEIWTQAAEHCLDPNFRWDERNLRVGTGS
ncbi:MAG: GIY-YIG nuclease family protein [Litorimonas sp.]